MKLFSALAASACLVLLFSCKKDSSSNSQQLDNAVQVFDSVVFGRFEFPERRFFSTIDTSLKGTLTEEQAKQNIEKIDMVYIFVNEQQYGPGFMDPYTASQQWYWDYDYLPWLDKAVKTTIFITRLTKEHYDSSMNNPALLDKYFADSSLMHVARHSIYPNGTCIGGRLSVYDWEFNTNSNLYRGQVIGFMHNSTLKKGLIYIRGPQSDGWPFPYYNFHTVVDIMRQQ
jgi:hypothetical protein